MKVCRKPLVMVVQSGCPDCLEAVKTVYDIKAKREDLKPVKIQIVDKKEKEELLKGYRHHSLPIFVVDEKIVFAGRFTRGRIEKVLERAMRVPQRVGGGTV